MLYVQPSASALQEESPSTVWQRSSGNDGSLLRLSDIRAKPDSVPERDNGFGCKETLCIEGQSPV
jgi:hypothetical protein